MHSSSPPPPPPSPSPPPPSPSPIRCTRSADVQRCLRDGVAFELDTAAWGASADDGGEGRHLTVEWLLAGTAAAEVDDENNNKNNERSDGARSLWHPADAPRLRPRSAPPLRGLAMRCCP